MRATFLSINFYFIKFNFSFVLSKRNDTDKSHIQCKLKFTENDIMRHKVSHPLNYEKKLEAAKEGNNIQYS